MFQPLAKCVLMPLGLRAVASAADTEILRLKNNSNINNITQRNGRHYENSLEDSSLLIKAVSETIQTKEKNIKVDFLVCY